MNNHQFNPIAVKDGTTMDAYIAFPTNNSEFPMPAIILLQEAFGVNSHIRSIAERLCSEGYAVIAPDLFHRTAKQIEIAYTDFQTKGIQHYQATNKQTLCDDVQACYDWLQTQTNINKRRIGCVGFCLGGQVTFLANTLLPLAAAVSYYGGRTEQYLDLATNMSAPHLFIWGGLDKHIPQEKIDLVIDAVKNAGKEYTNIIISNADHGFHCDERASYHPQAAKEAWAYTLQFLENKLKA